MAKSTRCEICQKRPVGGGVWSGYEDPEYSKSHGFCLPCGDEGQMSNSHHNGHESISEEECWYCHPELDETKKDYTERNGTSRAGMVIHVSLRAPGIVKAEEVANQLPNFATRIVKPTKRNAHTTKLILEHAGDNAFEIRWDDRGRFTYGELNGKKVRNVSDLLRKLAA